MSFLFLCLEVVFRKLYTGFVLYEVINITYYIFNFAHTITNPRVNFPRRVPIKTPKKCQKCQRLIQITKNLIYLKILIIINMLTNKHTFTTQKSIRTNCQMYQYVQQQVRLLLASPQLKGRIVIGEFDDYQWLELKCIVPLHSSMQFVEDLVAVTVLLRFRKDEFWLTPGLYLCSNHIASQYSYINIIDDLSHPHLTDNQPTQLLQALLQQIDREGLEKWALKTYKKIGQGQTININKQDVKQTHMVNLLYTNKQDNQNLLKNAIKNKIKQINQMKFQDGDCFVPTKSLLQHNSSFNTITNLSFNSQNTHNPATQKPKTSSFLTVPVSTSVQRGNIPTATSTMGQKNNHYKHIYTNMCDENEEIDDSKDDENNDQDDFDNVDLCEERRVIEDCQQDYKSQQQMNINIQKANNINYPNGNTIFTNPFSCFKPIVKTFSEEQPKNHTRSLFEGQSDNNFKYNGFIPYRVFKQIEGQFIGVRKNKIISSQVSNSTFNTQNLNLQIKPQGCISAQSASNSSIPVNGTSGSAQNKKQGKNPKPMNKNANLPKFLIRIFIKYVDKYKNFYVKREYDRLYSQCKKMKQWKKNDRRQHAFGLKHLKIFFQDSIEGFPDPALNRKVISKIIGNYLLEQICQNSQIPQSHRVGYLIACRVYSIRCRNQSLAGRIQSK